MTCFLVPGLTPHKSISILQPGTSSQLTFTVVRGGIIEIGMVAVRN